MANTTSTQGVLTLWFAVTTSSLVYAQAKPIWSENFDDPEEFSTRWHVSRSPMVRCHQWLGSDTAAGVGGNAIHVSGGGLVCTKEVLPKKAMARAGSIVLAVRALTRPFVMEIQFLESDRRLVLEESGNQETGLASARSGVVQFPTLNETCA